MILWATQTGPGDIRVHEAAAVAVADQPVDGTPADAAAAAADVHSDAAAPNDPLARAWMGTYYRLLKIGSLDLSLDYYIDGLTLVMFTMITLIATCIHVFSLAYMGDELQASVEDHVATFSNGQPVRRVGRFPLFFAYLSLFCFSMLGLILSGNLLQVFVFWELVGLCSYLLIGFYYERGAASRAANQAFIMNRVGDFGFLIGLMILWTAFGSFHFAETRPEAERGPGLFQLVRTAEGDLVTQGEGRERRITISATENSPTASIPYWLLTAAGLGLFAGCVGKSAQFPLQTWLPRAMEGPTPVSALVHSATMVAAGVYLVGRITPLLTPESLLVIAYVGCVTLFIGATIALVVTDIKQVLAYSTISQLGYMMLAMGVGGWIAGLFHLITHAFFKSLLFLCSGSVIHACHHEQDMTRLGGLRKVMPITCWTMFIGVVAICGLAVPMLPPIPVFGAVAFSGYHSKDSILSTALAFVSLNPSHSVLFIVPLLTAGLTAFYMFRLWFLTFWGTPRDAEIAEHVHESPRSMTGPLFVLAFFAMVIGAAGESGPLVQLLQTAEPAHLSPGVSDSSGLIFPGKHQIHEHHVQAGAAALIVAFIGTLLAYLFYAIGKADARGIRQQFSSLHQFLMNGWQFEALYDVLLVRPMQRIAHFCTAFDRVVLDRGLDQLAKCLVRVSGWDRQFDERVVDRAVNVVGESTWRTGDIFRRWQTGKLRHYVMSITVSLVVLFIVLFLCLPGH